MQLIFKTKIVEKQLLSINFNLFTILKTKINKKLNIIQFDRKIVVYKFGFFEKINKYFLRTTNEQIRKVSTKKFKITSTTID